MDNNDKKAFDKSIPMNSLFICVPLWGDDYIDNFFAYCLPSIVNNSDRDFFETLEVQVCFYTNESGKVNIQKTVSSIQSDKYENIVFSYQIFEPQRFANEQYSKYRALNYCHEQGMAKAHELGAVFMPLVADMLLSKGSVSTAFELISQGKQAVFVGNLRIVKEVFLEHSRFAQNNDLNAGHFAGWTGFELVDLALAEVHPKLNLTVMNSPGFDHSWPDFLYLVDEQNGVIQSGLYLHPLMIRPVDNFSLGEYTIDVSTAFLGDEIFFEDIHVVRDSESATCVSLADRHEFDHLCQESELAFNANKVGRFLAEDASISRFHLHFLDCPIQFKRVASSDMQALSSQAMNNVETIKNAYQQWVPIVKLERELADRFHVLNHTDPQSANEERVSEAIGRIGYEEVQRLASLVRDIVSVLPKTSNQPGAKSGLLVFGAGQHSDMLFKLSDLYSHTVALSDNDSSKWGKVVWGLQCISPSEIPQHATHVLVSSKEYEDEIAQQLEAQFDKQITVYRLYA